VGAEFLYWTAFDADLDYAVNNTAGYDVATTGGGVSEMHFADYDWDPGFRVFIGYEDPCDCWGGRASYLHFCSKNTNTATFGDGVTNHLKPTLWSPAFGNDRCQNATATTEIEYHFYDVTIGRTCCICEGVSFRPFGGFRGLKLDQKLDVVYDGGRDFTNYDGVVTWNSCFDGYGLTGGFDWNLSFCGCFCAYATVSASIVAGETDDLETQGGPEGVNGNTQIINNINSHEKQCIGVPGYQLAVGLCYEKCCETSCGCYCFNLGVGYEMNHWLNVPELRRFVGSGNEAANNGGGAKGCLLLHGLTVRGTVSF